MNNIEIMREFNRTVTRSIGIFNRQYLGRPRPLAASRLIYEIGTEGAEVRTLRDRLGVDSGYMSRLLRTLEKESLIKTEPSPKDRRIRQVQLTEAGIIELQELNRLSDLEMTELLTKLPEKKQQILTGAMKKVEQLLETAAVQLIRVKESDPRAQKSLESYYSELSDRFGMHFDPGQMENGIFFIADLHGATVGCGAVVMYPDFAEVKRMWVASSCRGRGIASKILGQLEAEAFRAGKKTVRLDTNDNLNEAKAMYRGYGYHEIERYNDNPFAQHFYEKAIAP